MAGKRKGLGKGLDALLGERPSVDRENTAPQQNMRQVPIEWIRPGKYQPRQHFAKEPLEELAASIKAKGLMQPVVIRPVGENRYELIAGERRWRASQLAGLDKIPAVINEVDDESAVAMSLIENIQREDLNPMEQAMALQRLINDFSLTHQQVADAIGKSRTGVTNFLRLLSLSEPVARMLESGDLEMGHARAMLVLPDAMQLDAARQVVAKKLSVRETEALVRRLSQPAQPKSVKATTKDVDVRRLEEKLSLKLGQPAHIQPGKKGAGKLVIAYSSLDELDGILNYFGELE
ncbi:MAG: ParB/RepB/Spo0J family partition protein [Gammaproteobacteria bacterium]|nr:ParB/RepB/Spo0J family partition protein [Gammaproteobacteria bacterium]